MEIVGKHMEREIREQPRLLASRAESYLSALSGFIDRDRYEMVVVAARGSSDNAAVFLRYLIEVNWGIPVVLAAPSVLTMFGGRIRYPRCLCVGISQSGAAPDVAAVLQSAREAGHPTLAITNVAGSVCEQIADFTLALNAGEEKSVAATKTYTLSLLACYQLARCGCAGLTEPRLPDDAFSAHAHDYASEVASAVSDARVVFALGRGYSFSSAHECALKLIECALIPCKAYSSADFEHGPKALLASDALSIVFGQAPVSIRDARGKQINAVGGEGAWGPIWDAIFAQWLALLVARLRGLNPDSPAFLSKVTKTV